MRDLIERVAVQSWVQLSWARVPAADVEEWDSLLSLLYTTETHGPDKYYIGLTAEDHTQDIFGHFEMIPEYKLFVDLKEVCRRLEIEVNDVIYKQP